MVVGDQAKFLSQVKGFTPVIDVLAKELGTMTALVYGIVWRYCQMEDKVCRASKQTIAANANIDAKTVQRHLHKLAKSGYLEDLTPGLKHAPHSYKDTGRIQIIGLVEARLIGRTESPTSEEGRTESPTRGDTESHLGRTESPVMIEIHDSPDERKKGGGQKTPPAPSPSSGDYLTDVFNGHTQGLTPGVADPTQDQERWFEYHDQATKLYKDLTGYYPDTKVGKPAILDLVSAPDFDLQKWRQSIESCRLAGVKPTNVGCVIDTYKAGGDYGEMQRRRNGGQPHGSHKPIRQGHAPNSGGAGSSLTPEQRQKLGIT